MLYQFSEAGLENLHPLDCCSLLGVSVPGRRAWSELLGIPSTGWERFPTFTPVYTVWLTDWLARWLTGSLTYWLTGSLTVSHKVNMQPDSVFLCSPASFFLPLCLSLYPSLSLSLAISSSPPLALSPCLFLPPYLSPSPSFLLVVPPLVWNVSTGLNYIQPTQLSSKDHLAFTNCGSK